MILQFILVFEDTQCFLKVCSFVGTASVLEVLWPLATSGHKGQLWANPLYGPLRQGQLLGCLVRKQFFPWITSNGEYPW